MSKKEKDSMRKWYADLIRNPMKYVEDMGKRLMNREFRQTIPLFYFADPHIWENNFTQVTVTELISKMRDFLASKPKEVNYSTFLYYMAYFPVSMCKRSLSPLLKKVIGFHYQFGIPTEKEYIALIKSVSMDELAEIFGRSKATIHECVKATAPEWKKMQEEIERSWRLEVEAKRQLLEEKKEEIRKKKASETALDEKTSD